ncbi:diphthine methyl ester synthase isoform X3 [Pan paniscus]|uniref:diphthine methyl ester synthase isoform X3 n=1 Tax=Pan paniscus TaxID=9597 RepID=UPI0004F04169|nr:diphthine methyl ester synthase isoform X3 [Pan paniscus]XP_009424728.1 diphthine methyl ester synthase isoform X3 [Pan troglodytes]
MLYLIGLGLGDAKDITVKGLEVVRRCSRVYLEAYTSVLTVGKEALEEFYGRKLVVADREEVEQEADNILKDADISDVAFLVVGDPFGATTHSDLVLRATKLGIPYRVIHNASIMNAVGCCGLQLYKFGETVSIVFWTDTWRPESFFDKVKKNRQNGMHTLCLLDIKVKEQSLENLINSYRGDTLCWLSQSWSRRPENCSRHFTANVYCGLGRTIAFLDHHRRQHTSNGDGDAKSVFHTRK